MSWSRRAFLLTCLPAALALSGCGFHPLYGKDDGRSSTVPDLASIKIETIADRTGQLVQGALMDRLTPKGKPAKPKYFLRVTLSETKQGLGILKDETASRTNYVLRANFSLTDKDGRSLYNSTASSQASFNILSEHYASTSSERDARDRTTVEIADAITAQLAAYFSRARDPQDKAKP